jgi:hypothetical protein
MKQLASPLMLLVMLSACAPSSESAEERRAEAARADSSAAGYDVSEAKSREPQGAVPASGLSTAGRDSVRSPTGTTGGPIARPGVSGPVTPAPIGTPAPPVTVPRQLPVAAIDTAKGGRQGRGGSPTLDPGTGLPPLDPAIAATFLSFDEAKKTATFELASGTELPGEVSFNAARRGGRTLIIPVGWRLTIEFTNRDAGLPHSAAIVESVDPVPEQLPPPAFPRAGTMNLEEGLLEGATDEIMVVADRPGRYLIACGVLGHAQRGQWLVLEVSPTATVPVYR